MEAFLLAMQAAGIIFDVWSTHNKQKLIDMGQQLDAASVESALVQTRAQTEQASLAAMENLRKTIGTQMVIQAARGTAGGVGSALVVSEGSRAAFNKDERTRRLNLLFRETQIKGAGTNSMLRGLSAKDQLTSSLAGRLFNILPISQTMANLGKPSEFSGNVSSAGQNTGGIIADSLFGGQFSG